MIDYEKVIAILYRGCIALVVVAFFVILVALVEQYG